MEAVKGTPGWVFGPGTQNSDEFNLISHRILYDIYQIYHLPMLGVVF